MKDAVSRAAFSGALTVLLIAGAVSSAFAGVVVPTQHNDNQRTGANLGETALTPAAVAAWRLRRVDRSVDGMINTQILYAPGVMVGGKPRDVAYVTTSANSVYAFDADDRTPGAQHGLLWHRALLDPKPAYARGISATPVLEIANGSGTIDVLYSTAANWLPFAVFVKDELELRKHLAAHFYLVKLDLATGKTVVPAAELHGSMVRDDGVTMTFDPNQENDVASLLLDHGYVYVSFSARQNENVSQYYGWMLRYNAADLAYAGAFNTTPHSWHWTSPTPPSPVPVATGSPTLSCYHPVGGRLDPWERVPPIAANAMACVGEGGGIWQGGAGPAADRDGNVYVMTGNGHYDPGEGSYGDSIVRLHSKPGGGTSAADFGVDRSWAPSERDGDETYDVDLGSAGPMVVDGAARRVVGGGKTGIFYVVDGELAPKQSIVAGVDHRAADPGGTLRYQTWNQGPHLHGSPTFWAVSPAKGYVYEWAEKDYLKKYEFDRAHGVFNVRSQIAHPWVARENDILAAPCVMAVLCLNAMPGGMLTVTANGTDESSGIVWAVLRAYDLLSQDRIYAFRASDLKLLWWDAIGAVPHFAGPTVADGHVFVPTNSMQWRFSIYSLAPPAAAVKHDVHPRPLAPPPPNDAKYARFITALAHAQMMPMRTAPRASKIEDYASDPLFRARLALPALIEELPPGTIVDAAYAVFGNERYTCTSAKVCIRTGTQITNVFPYDDRTGPNWFAEIGGAPCSYAGGVNVAPTPLFPEWQLLRNPCAAFFGHASYVARTWSAFLGAPRGRTVSVPFFALYTGFTQGAT
jgi:hypothetical protein